MVSLCGQFELGGFNFALNCAVVGLVLDGWEWLLMERGCGGDLYFVFGFVCLAFLEWRE